MPRRKKNSKAAKKRLNKQGNNSDTGQFNDNNDVYVPSSEYSEDSSDEEFINKRIQQIGRFELIWSNDSYNKRKKPYIGNSIATKYRKHGPSGTFTQAAKSIQPITNFFNYSNSHENDVEIGYENDTESVCSDDEQENDAENDDEQENDVESDGEVETECDHESDDKSDIESDSESENRDDNVQNNDEQNIKIKIEKLENILSGNKKKIAAYDYLQYSALHLFFIYWKQYNLTRIKASLRSAKEVYNKGKYKAQQIRKWANYWIENDTLPKSKQGCHQKIKSLIDDEDIVKKSLIFIRENGNKITPKVFQNFINKDLLSRMNISRKSISIQTARIWLKKLGLVPQSRKKGIYFDGHEREDVLEYREYFLKEMQDFERLMPTFEGESMEQKNPLLLDHEKLHILVTHDECLFYSNDDRPIVWAPLGQPPLRKKGQGKSIMVSDFLLETIGRLKLTEQESLLNSNIPSEARKYLKPGKNEEGWWTAEHLISQVIDCAIPIFEVLYPNAVAVFAFDNSTNHGAMAKDALYVMNMNVNPGGKQALMRSTSFGPNETFQSMVFSPNHPTYPNKPKGMKQVLIERGLWYDGLVGHCQLCKLKIDDITRTDCCMQKILSLQEDFKVQKSQLQEEIEKRGHKCIFYPKYHCELNFIEMYWGAAKRYARDRCDYKWSSLQKVVPEALDSVPLITIRKYAQKSWRYMDIYRKGITGKLAEYAVKKYKSHRRVPDSIYNEIK